MSWVSHEVIYSDLKRERGWITECSVEMRGPIGQCLWEGISLYRVQWDLGGARCISGCRGGEVSVFRDKLLRGLMFLGTDGCLAVQDRCELFRSLSPPRLNAAPSSKRHLTAKHSRSRTGSKNQPIMWECAAHLWACEIARDREWLPLLLRKILFHHSKTKEKSAWKISHSSCLFRGADFCLCLAQNVFLWSFTHRTKLTDGHLAQRGKALVCSQKKIPNSIESQAARPFIHESHTQTELLL